MVLLAIVGGIIVLAITAIVVMSSVAIHNQNH
jgi:hypothetical protein